MIEIIKELDVEVTKPNIFQAVVAKQYDMNTRFLKVTLKDCGNRIDVPLIDTAKVVINAERKDGQSKGFEGVINEDGTVTVPLHSWMLELDGTVICDISVIDTAADDNKKLTTTSFTLLVEKAAFGGADITTDPQYDVLVELLETCDAASVAAEEALRKSQEADAKYAACVEATADAIAVREEVEAGGYIESIKEQNTGAKATVWMGSQEEYDALETKLNNCLYIITNDEIVSIEHGGTGANTAAQALKNFGVTDHIVEQGTSGVWQYTKYASGKCELYGTVHEEATVDVQKGSIFRSEILWEKLPFMVYGCHAFGDCTDANAWASRAPMDMDTEYIGYNIWNGESGTYDWYTQWYVVGKWK